MTTMEPRHSEVEVGDALPQLALPLTTSLIVGGALASRDYTPVHHDRGAAQAAGRGDPAAGPSAAPTYPTPESPIARRASGAAGATPTRSSTGRPTAPPAP